MKRIFSKSLFFLILSTLIISCTGEKLVPTKGPDGEPGTELNFAQFDDIPIPSGSSLNQEDSIIISKNMITLISNPIGIWLLLRLEANH